MSKDENNEETDLNKYQNFDGVSLKEMNFGLWLSERRQKIIKSLTVCLIIICAALFVYSSYNLIVYLKSSDPNAWLANGEIPVSPRNITSDLEIGPVQILSSGGHYDFAVKLKNPNDKFMSTFKYCFRQNDQDLACDDNFILPSEEKYILVLAQDLKAGETGITFNLTNTFWTRINAHNISNWSEFLSDRLNMAISEVNFSTDSSSANQNNFNNLEFTIANQTPYNYYGLPVNILLFDGQELVGVNRYKINNFMSAEKRLIKISWPGALSSVSRTEIQPDINILDDSVYLKYNGQLTN